MNVRYCVELSHAERGQLDALLSGASTQPVSSSELRSCWRRPPAAAMRRLPVAVGGSTVYRTKRRLVEGNLERALSKEPRTAGYPCKR
jgi:hypothetical protein